jgi:hypothetical protein
MRVAGAVLMVICLTSRLAAQVSAFRFQADRVRTGVVYHYNKSNLDGTHATNVSVFVPDSDRLESFKWTEGGREATLVKAWLDWSTFTVRRFESARVQPSGETPVATLAMVPGAKAVVIELRGTQRRTDIKNWPWQSYDFDFAGLSAILPHLVNPERSFRIGIADAGADSAGPAMFDKGIVTLEFVRRETRDGRTVRRYTIDGPGLEHKGGGLWTDLDGGFLVGFEIALPDEEGMKNGKLALRAVEKMDDAAWAQFRRIHVGQ